VARRLRSSAGGISECTGMTFPSEGPAILYGRGAEVDGASLGTSCGKRFSQTGCIFIRGNGWRRVYRSHLSVVFEPRWARGNLVLLANRPTRGARTVTLVSWMFCEALRGSTCQQAMHEHKCVNRNLLWSNEAAPHPPYR
jgi:hypothetical protein